MTCSIGVGCNKTVAKIASERDKPFGLTIVRPGTEQRFLAALPVSAMSGIGRSAEERLRRMRIYTLGELSRAPESTLASIFGVNGEHMRQRALGLEISEVTSLDEEREVKSVSNERTFAKDLTERGDIEAAIALLGESVGRRLRRQGLTGATVTLKLKYSYGSGRTAQRRLPHPTDDENIFVAVALELLDNIWQDGMHVRLAGIGMSDFDHQAASRLTCSARSMTAEPNPATAATSPSPSMPSETNSATPPYPSAANPASTINRLWAKKKAGRCGNRNCRRYA